MGWSGWQYRRSCPSIALFPIEYHGGLLSPTLDKPSSTFCFFAAIIRLMVGEITNTRLSLAAPEIVKAKVAVIDVVDNVPSILVLTRSIHEDTRIGEGDWPGGKLEPGEEPYTGLIRETGQEVPRATLYNITKLAVRSRTKNGEQVTSHLYAANATLPSGPIELSIEHSGAEWVPLDEFPQVPIPNKYKRAVASESGRLVIEALL